LLIFLLTKIKKWILHNILITNQFNMFLVDLMNLLYIKIINMYCLWNIVNYVIIITTWPPKKFLTVLDDNIKKCRNCPYSENNSYIHHCKNIILLFICVWRLYDYDYLGTTVFKTITFLSELICVWTCLNCNILLLPTQKLF